MKPIRDRQVFPQRLHVMIPLPSMLALRVVSKEEVAWQTVCRQFMRLVACVVH